MKNKKQLVLSDQSGEFFVDQLHLSGEINNVLFSEFDKSFSLLEKSGRKCFIFLKSLGGHFEPAKLFFERLSNSKIEITMVAGDEVSSLAILVFLGCKRQGVKRCFVREETKMFFHLTEQKTRYKVVPYVTDRVASHGVLDEDIDYAHFKQDFFNEVILSVLKENAKASFEELISFLKREPTLSSQELIEIGIADGYYPDDLP